jgi:hypothetical protein
MEPHHSLATDKAVCPVDGRRGIDCFVGRRGRHDIEEQRAATLTDRPPPPHQEHHVSEAGQDEAAHCRVDRADLTVEAGISRAYVPGHHYHDASDTNGQNPADEVLGGPQNSGR